MTLPLEASPATITADELYKHLGRNAPWPEGIPGLRPWQVDVIVNVAEDFLAGAKVVFLEAPTGAGKTVIAEGVRRYLGVAAAFTCSTRSLQRQVVADFPEARLLEGRSNYTPHNPGNGASGWFDCSDCDASKTESGGVECSLCDPVSECPYRVAKAAAEASPLAVLNTSYLLHAMKYAGMFTDRELHIVDEADLLPDALCDFAGVEVKAAWCKDAKISPPSNVSDIAKLNGTIAEWAEEAVGKLKRLAEREEDSKEADKIASAISQLRSVGADDTVRWIVEGVDRDNRSRYPKITLKAVHSRPVAHTFMANVERVLIMSATLLSADLMALDLDLEPHEWTARSVPAPFAPETRIVVAPKGLPTLTKKVLDDGVPLPTQSALKKILDSHDGERLLIHVPSYRLGAEVVGLCKDLAPGRGVMTYENAQDREGALQRWLETSNHVLVASSFARGIDLKGDTCRAQVIFKVAVPNIGAPQVKARLYGAGPVDKSNVGANGDVWMNLHTIRELVQASGRVCRSGDDWGVTYVLDGKLFDLHRRAKDLFPKWFMDAVVTNGKTASGKRLLEGYREVSGVDIDI